MTTQTKHNHTSLTKKIATIFSGMLSAVNSKPIDEPKLIIKEKSPIEIERERVDAAIQQLNKWDTIPTEQHFAPFCGKLKLSKNKASYELMIEMIISQSENKRQEYAERLLNCR